MKLQKELYLAEAHLGISELEGNYLREAAGPYDHALIEDTEQAMAAAGFYRADQPQSRGTTVTYRLLAKAGEHNAELDAEAARPSDASGADLAINTRSAAASKNKFRWPITYQFGKALRAA